jgi:hypothetical protein
MRYQAVSTPPGRPERSHPDRRRGSQPTNASPRRRSTPAQRQAGPTSSLPAAHRGSGSIDAFPTPPHPGFAVLVQPAARAPRPASSAHLAAASKTVLQPVY